MINIYPSTLPGEPMEVHECDGMTLGEWLSANVDNYEAGPDQPISAKVNGELLDPLDWAGKFITDDDVVDIRVQPQGMDPITIGLIAAAVISAAAAFLLKPSVPNINSQGSKKGSSIYEVSAQGNQPKLGDVIPEHAGRHKKYPDYLCAPVRRFYNLKQQELFMFFSLGEGYFVGDINDVLIGSTPINSLSGTSLTFYDPGQSVAGERAAQNWYNAPEVGASTGSSGLRLRGISTQDASFDGNGRTIGRELFISGNYLPEAWDENIRLVVRIRQPFTVGTNRESFFGDFRHLSDGQQVTILAEGLSGIYFVRSASATGMLLRDAGGNPLTNFTPGDYVGSVDRTNSTYGVESRDPERRGVTMQRYTSTGALDSTWPSFPQINLASVSITPSSTIPAGVLTGPFFACPEGKTTTRFEWDLFCPNGLGYLEDDESISYRERTVELQWRDGTSGSWNTIQRTIGGATRDALGFTFVEDIPSARPQITVRRAEAEDEDTRAFDRIEWYGLRAQLPQANSYEGVSTLAVKITGSDLIASQTENQINLIQTRCLSVIENGAWTPDLRPTRSIAPWINYVAKSVGYQDTDLDLPELFRLNGVWEPREDYYDYITEEVTTAKEAMNAALRAGFAEITIRNGLLRPARDEPRSLPEHAYSPQNMTKPLLRVVDMPRPGDFDGVDVTFFNQETWTEEVVKCRFPGDQGFKTEAISVPGVLDRTRAWRIGMRRRAELAYQRWSYQFETELDALNSYYRSVCLLIDNLPGYTRSSIIKRVERATPARLHLSESFGFVEGAMNVIAWRKPDGSVSAPTLATPTEDPNVVEVSVPLNQLPIVDFKQEPPHAYMGTADKFGFKAIVTAINPQGFKTVQGRAVNYDDRIYLNDNAFPE